MQIESVHIKNLRSISDATVNFDGYTCIVGPNGAGKSTVLLALNIFFRQTQDSPTAVSILKRIGTFLAIVIHTQQSPGLFKPRIPLVLVQVNTGCCRVWIPFTQDT